MTLTTTGRLALQIDAGVRTGSEVVLESKKHEHSSSLSRGIQYWNPLEREVSCIACPLWWIYTDRL